MASHKFRVGQVVDFNPSQVGVTASAREYKILRLLPHEGSERLYAIKTIVEPLERVGKESGLAHGTCGDAQRSVLKYGERRTLFAPLSSSALETRYDDGFGERTNEMTVKEGRLQKIVKCDDDIHVGRGENKSWLVTRGNQRTELASYRLKNHAMAFARAVAFSRHAEMIVHDRDGRSTRHQRAALTYPTSLG
jgi:hypothetical protein